jgi:argininosuccinate lyase
VSGKDVPWGGRFTSGPHPDMMRLSSSITIDIRLLPQDVKATAAHARALGRSGLLQESEVTEMERELDAILADHYAGVLEPEGDEDVHSFVQRVLTERLGDLGARIHAGRSRNDLVAADLRLWCKDTAARLASEVADLVDALIDVAAENLDTLMPGYTHLQRAQPISLAHQLSAHACALTRDGDRFLGAYRSADESPLGAGALAGTTLPIDPVATAEDLGFTRVFSNAMDAVASRDFVADLLYASACCGVELSRLAEEIVLWTSAEFSFARLADDWSTGSSMMPQKRNPDIAELGRGRAALQIGDLASLLALVKGLPLAYNRDLQADKEIVFRATDRVSGSMAGMTHLLRSLTFDGEAMSRAAGDGGMSATYLAEILVSRGVPFREAHEAVGGLVADLEAREMTLPEATGDDLTGHHERFAATDLAALEPRRELEERRSHGGPAPERAAEQLEHLRSASRRLRAPGRE